MSGFAKGGILPDCEQRVPVTIERVGQAADGRCLYSINGGPPEHIWTRAEALAIGRRTLNALRAPRLWEGDQA